MIIDFASINAKNKLVLLLKNLDGKVIQTLGYAYNIKGEFNYNETSKLTFQYPAHVDGKATSGYDKIVGMRIIDAIGIGQFILVNPSIQEDATKEIKTITAYSLEYEFTYKKISLENSTYNFWNPVAPDNTIIGIIMSIMPSWKIGKIDDTLIGRYRTFEIMDSNVYNFIKSTLQDTYNCIFEFDTINRTVNVRDISKKANIQPVYISLNNLAKEITINEDTEGIFTCLDVNGADGVTIRGVNPMGINKIYNLDYFMTIDNFSQNIIDKWNNWKETYNNNQELYFNLTVENALLHMQIETEKAALTTLKGERTVIEQLQSAAIEASAAGIPQDLSQYVIQLQQKDAEISEKEALISELENKMSDSDNALKAINVATAWESFGFTDEELKIIDRYIKEDAITDSTFVAPVVDNYVGGGTSYPSANTIINISGATIIGSTLSNGKVVYKANGGEISVSVNGEIKLSGPNVISAFDNMNGQMVCSVYCENGCATLTGNASLSSDVHEDPEIGGSYIEGTYATITSTTGTIYITENLSAYAQRSIEWELFDYGQECLRRVAYPSYTFNVDSGNFLCIDEFISFTQKLKLGDKIYLNLGSSMGVLDPVVIGVNIDFETKELSLVFSDKFYLSDGAFKLSDILDQSISMGKSVDFNKYNYNAFINTGASTEVRDFMTSALDASKNAVLSASGQAVSWDGAGLRFRKWADESQTEYLDEQIWIINNNIVFTDDNWNTAKMAIGKFTDENSGECWGIAAPNVVGTLLAGENLVIESAKQDGGTSVFKVDADGARLFNSRFDLVNNFSDGTVAKVGQIGLNASIGIVAGSATSQNAMYTFDEKGNISGVKTSDGNSVTRIADLGDSTPVPNFWVDMYGDVYLKGTIYATDGVFSGTIYAKDGVFSGTLEAAKVSGALSAEDDAWLEGIGIRVGKNATANKGYNFYVDTTGNVWIDGNLTLKNGAITWSNLDYTTQSNINNANENANNAFGIANNAFGIANDANENAINSLKNLELLAKGQYQGGSFIDGRNIYAPNLYGDSITLLDGNGRRVGTMTLKYQESYAFDLASDLSLRLQSAYNNNVYISNGPAWIQMLAGGRLTLSGSAIVINESNFGSSLPSGGTYGQIFFKMV